MAADGAPDQDLPEEALASLGDASDALDRGKTLAKEGDVRKAIDEVLLARALEPKNLEAALLHAELLLKSKDTSAAIQTYEEALKISPDDATAKAALAKLQPKKK